MKQTFQVGDRVRVYGFSGPSSIHNGVVGRHRLGGFLEIRTDNPGGLINAHPKQCRRLRKRKPREWWIAFTKKDGKFYNINQCEFRPPLYEPDFECIKVREVIEAHTGN